MKLVDISVQEELVDKMFAVGQRCDEGGTRKVDKGVGN